MRWVGREVGCEQEDAVLGGWEVCEEGYGAGEAKDSCSVGLMDTGWLAVLWM